MAKSSPSFPKGFKVVKGPTQIPSSSVIPGSTVKVTNNDTTITDKPTTKDGSVK